MVHLTEADRGYISAFVAVAGEAIEECPGAESSLLLLFGACKEASGPRFIPMGSFDRLLRATGYERTSRRYGVRYKGIRPKDPALQHRVWYAN
ncbi:hypothetical protein [Streptomyces sp. VRA16 Mangrove soil]|uniref:hypothetical protein n=1 Tax=Streptomyces sp. VRA16 Mangrove soil TaxID=2817434 RepID=UPI001A9E663F|nr:hypothetical protein [Streptomyces sp. VRA16 Mangrove soil]MBO1333787.1 hypothetical protein [Streptomyces sp. VRA16 Mangrove soil]